MGAREKPALNNLIEIIHELVVQENSGEVRDSSIANCVSGSDYGAQAIAVMKERVFGKEVLGAEELAPKTAIEARDSGIGDFIAVESCAKKVWAHNQAFICKKREVELEHFERRGSESRGDFGGGQLFAENIHHLSDYGIEAHFLQASGKILEGDFMCVLPTKVLIHIKQEAPAVAPHALEHPFSHFHLVSAKRSKGMKEGDALKGFQNGGRIIRGAIVHENKMIESQTAVMFDKGTEVVGSIFEAAKDAGSAHRMRNGTEDQSSGLRNLQAAQRLAQQKSGTLQRAFAKRIDLYDAVEIGNHGLSEQGGYSSINSSWRTESKLHPKPKAIAYKLASGSTSAS